jgi:hypothetical protein
LGITLWRFSFTRRPRPIFSTLPFRGDRSFRFAASVGYGGLTALVARLLNSDFKGAGLLSAEG